MGRIRQLTWCFVRSEFPDWLAGKNVVLVSDSISDIGASSPHLVWVSILVDEDNHQSILGLPYPIDEDGWDD